MTLKTSPKAFASVGEAVCFVLADVAAPTVPLEVRIESPLKTDGPLGLKRMYAAADRSLAVNVAPYLRTLLAPRPFTAAARTAPVRIVVSGGGVATYTSPYVTLAAGKESLPANEILSSGPSARVVGPTDVDEIAVVTSATVQPLVVFEYNGGTCIDASMDDVTSKDMIAVRVDVAKCIQLAAAKAMVHSKFVTAFKIRLRLTSGGTVTYLDRSYTIDRAPRTGVRLGWVNRLGAIDCHTFPVLEKITHRAGERVRTLASESLNTQDALWLAEILDSPIVWQMDALSAEPVDLVDGALVISPAFPSFVTLAIKPKE